jgi:hypothetical protein
MENFSPELIRAQTEAFEIQKKAREEKAKRVSEQGKKNSEPMRSDYENASQLNECKRIDDLIIGDEIGEMHNDLIGLYNTYEEQMAGQYDEQKFKELEKLSEEFEEGLPEKIKQIEDKYKHNIKTISFLYELEVLKKVGLDTDGLRATIEDMVNTLGIDNRSSIENSYYTSLVSLIRKLMEKIGGKTIVEIGPGSEGVLALKYFQKKGANVIGIDPFSKSDIVIRGAWEEIDKILGGKKADVIYFHHMTPVPEGASERYANDASAYAEHIISEMNKALNDNGVIIQHNIAKIPDYHLPSDIMSNCGYLETSFEDLTVNDSIDPEIADSFNKARNGLNRINKLTVYQKAKVK